MLFRLPADQPMRPHYVFQPLRPCETFHLILRFPADRQPPAIRLLDGVTTREIDDPRYAAPLIRLDRLGELRLGFHDLHQGLAYGVTWS
jgi:hypothetical protein